MVKRLRQVGNSSALLLDKAVMELVGLEQGGEVQITVQGGALVITPANPRLVSPERFETCLRRVVHRRRAVLRKLAE